MPSTGISKCQNLFLKVKVFNEGGIILYKNKIISFMVRILR